MDNTKKIILMCTIPVVLTILFIVLFTVPAVSQYFDLTAKIKKHEKIIKSTKSSISLLKSNKKLADDLEKLNTELIGFDIEFPQAYQDEVLLIDLEVFANQSMNRIVELKSMSEKKIEIKNPEEENKKKKRRRKREKVVPPLEIMEKPFNINTVAYYNEIIDFVKFLESYQRKVNIRGITAQIFSEDKENINPRVEMKIAASSYKSIINDVVDEEEDKKEKPKNAKSKK